jgi:hypothetical protein
MSSEDEIANVVKKATEKGRLLERQKIREETHKLSHRLREIEGKARRGNREKAPQTREEAIKEAADELEELREELLEQVKEEVDES